MKRPSLPCLHVHCRVRTIFSNTQGTPLLIAWFSDSSCVIWYRFLSSWGLESKRQCMTHEPYTINSLLKREFLNHLDCFQATIYNDVSIYLHVLCSIFLSTCTVQYLSIYMYCAVSNCLKLIEWLLCSGFDQHQCPWNVLRPVCCQQTH